MWVNTPKWIWKPKYKQFKKNVHTLKSHRKTDRHISCRQKLRPAKTTTKDVKQTKYFLFINYFMKNKTYDKYNKSFYRKTVLRKRYIP